MLHCMVSAIQPYMLAELDHQLVACIMITTMQAA
jgi:hypothetical protein